MHAAQDCDTWFSEMRFGNLVEEVLYYDGVYNMFQIQANPLLYNESR